MPIQSISEVVDQIAQQAEGFSGLFRRMHYVPLLSLLELPHTSVTQDLRRTFLSAGLTDSNYDAISLSELVAFALRSSSDYWRGLAVQWLANGFPMDEMIARAGNEMIKTKGGSQGDRQTLFRLIRQWERNR